MIKQISKCVAAAALVALAACGGGDEGPSYAGEIDYATTEQLSDASANLMSTTLFEVFGGQDVATPEPFLARLASEPDPRRVALDYLAHVRRLTEMKGGVGPMAVARAGRGLDGLQLAAMVCEPTITGTDQFGDPIDTDDDGMPDDYKVDFGSACTETGGGETYTISGFFRFRDTGTGFVSFAFTVGNLKVKLTVDSTGNYFSQGVNGSESGTFAASLAEHHFDVTMNVAIREGTETFAVSVITSEDATYDPDAGQSFTLFGPLPAGLLDYTADYRIVGENSGGGIPGNFRFSLDTPTPLHHDPLCGFDFDAGVFEGFLNGDSDIGFRFTWTGCASPTVLIFGTSDGPPIT